MNRDPFSQDRFTRYGRMGPFLILLALLLLGLIVKLCRQ